MPYTTQGFMTPEDINDFERLTDTGRHPDCPGHADGMAAPELTYCSRAENCDEAEEWGPPPGLEPM
jgi:hypothetical protein